MILLTISQRERQAARAFRGGQPISEIAAILGVCNEDAEAWLDSERIDEACQAVTRSDTHRNRKKHK